MVTLYLEGEMNPIISEKIKASLKLQTNCPKCGASWKELDDSLHESMDSPNWYLALLLLKNCRICALRFQDEYRHLTRLGGDNA